MSTPHTLTTTATIPVMERQLTLPDIAQRAGVSIAAIRAHRLHGTMPEPDGQLGRTPWWWESTIDSWLPTRRRPGKPQPRRD